jgi:hypothetical protein
MKWRLQRKPDDKNVHRLLHERTGGNFSSACRRFIAENAWHQNEISPDALIDAAEKPVRKMHVIKQRHLST